MSKYIALFFVLASFSTHLFANSCPMFFKSEKLCLEQKWEVMPTKTTVGKMKLTFKDSQGRIISPVNDPFVLLWMSSMGHGSTPVTITQVEDGVYSVTNVKFIMGGPWEIHYQLKDGKRIIEEHIQKITIR
jgi:hypothetical protein